ncbi:MAG: CoA-binding protein [Clostridiales bacterium]|jgi:predicted CoA-binding protein|nr:CoA-binding protein [Clostridiales bacterium]
MNNKEKMKDMMSKKVWAVVGASNKPDKVSNEIYHTLKSFGYETYAVNPSYNKMDDESKCYPSIEELPKVPDCINFVVPPTVTLKYLEELDPEITPNIWLQPGTYDDNVVRYAEDKGFNVVHEGECTMAYLRLYG